MKPGIAILLLPLLISSWLGVAIWEHDPSGDDRIDLEDAILRIKDFASTGEKPGDFAASVEKLISTLQVIVGLKTFIKPGMDTRSGSNSSYLNLAYLVSSCSPSIPPNIPCDMPERVFYRKSAECKPTTPPPKNPPACLG